MRKISVLPSEYLSFIVVSISRSDFADIVIKLVERTEKRRKGREDKEKK